VSGEAGIESLENEKKNDATVSDTLLKILETIPVDTLKDFLQSVLVPAEVLKKRNSEKVPVINNLLLTVKLFNRICITDMYN